MNIEHEQTATRPLNRKCIRTL